jgi:hypothetical protein
MNKKYELSSTYNTFSNMEKKAVQLEQDQLKKAVAEYQGLPRKIGTLCLA